MSYERIRQIFDIVFSSPLHIDAGREAIIKRHEFRLHNCQFIRLDGEILLERIGDEEDLLNRFIEEGAEVLPLNHPALKEGEVYRVGVDFARVPKEIFSHVADGTGNFYVPGSSLKGAIRTALLWTNLDTTEEIQNQILRRERKDAGEPLQRAVFTKDSRIRQWQNYDLMRVLKVRDSNSIPPKGHVRIVETRVGDLRNNRFEWIYTSYVEVPRVQPGELWVEVLVDNWLLYDEKARQLEFQRKADWMHEWGKRCNQFAEHLIQHEIEFAQKYQTPFLERFYQYLRTKMRQSPESVFLQIGWGAGWTAKTVTLGYEQGFINKVYDKFRLGRIQRRHRNCGGTIRRRQRDNVCTRCNKIVNRWDIELHLIQPFPKTRKIAFQNGQPHQPMGWLELRPISAIKKE